MKKIFVYAMILVNLSLLAKTKQLKNFDELMQALNSGEIVRIVVHYGDCQLISQNEVQERSPNAIGGMNIDVYEYFAPMSIGNQQAFVSFSQAKLINHGGFIYNYAKIRVYDDNKVKITAQYLDPEDFELEMDENFFSEINDEKNDGAVYFYLNE